MRASSIALAVLFVGCANTGDQGMFILNNSAPNGGQCAFTSDPSQPFLARGTLAAGAPTGYVLTPLIESRITALAGHEQERTIHLQGANVTLSQVSSTGSLSQTAQFTALFSGSVGPEASVNVSFEILPAMAAAGEYSANVTVFGTLGSSTISGEPFDYPVTVCTNCITRNLGICPQMTVTSLGNPCNPFQDGVVDCCMSGTTLVCPATTM